MELLINILQVTVGLSVAYVWTFRLENVFKEFEQFGLSDLTRNAVGVSKISLATLLIAGIWFPPLILVPSIFMSGFMICAQYFHFKANNSFIKHLPSMILLLLSMLIAYSTFIK